MASAYGSELISERHRHRYEFNNAFREEIESKGMLITGTSPTGELVETVEIPEHPFYIGVQFHPELNPVRTAHIPCSRHSSRHL